MLIVSHPWLRILFVEEADILIVQIHIYKTANFSLFCVEMLAQFGECSRQAAERLSTLRHYIRCSPVSR